MIYGLIVAVSGFGAHSWEWELLSMKVPVSFQLVG